MPGALHDVQPAVLSVKKKWTEDRERNKEEVCHYGIIARLTCRKPFLANCKIFKA